MEFLTTAYACTGAGRMPTLVAASRRLGERLRREDGHGLLHRESPSAVGVAADQVPVVVLHGLWLVVQSLSCGHVVALRLLDHLRRVQMAHAVRANAAGVAQQRSCDSAEPLVEPRPFAGRVLLADEHKLGDPRYDKKKAQYLLKPFVELHPHAIGEKGENLR